MSSTHNPMDNPEFLDAINGATLPGMTCSVEFGGYLQWDLGHGFYATPGHCGAEGIAIQIDRGDGIYTEVIPVIWTGDGVEDAHRYLAAMRRWQRNLPTLFCRWDGMPDTDWSGTLLDFCAEFDRTNAWDSGDWFGPGVFGDDCCLLDLLDTSLHMQGFALRCDNMEIQSEPFAPACDD